MPPSTQIKLSYRYHLLTWIHNTKWCKSTFKMNQYAKGKWFKAGLSTVGKIQITEKQQHKLFFHQWQKLYQVISLVSGPTVWICSALPVVLDILLLDGFQKMLDSLVFKIIPLAALLKHIFVVIFVTISCILQLK